jgi:SP family arabinose:H+ symporter-like MFS transporter
MFLLAYGFNSATYTVTEESTASLEELMDVTRLEPILDKEYSNDIEFKDAIATVLGSEDATKYESEIIKASIHMNPTLILFAILGFVASFAISIGPVMWVLFSELFPNRIRGIAISFVGLINSAVSFLVQWIFPWELANFGTGTTFLIYGVFAAIGLFFVVRVIPETKGKSLEELESLLVKK